MSAGVLSARREGRVRLGAMVGVFLLMVLGMVGRAAEVMPPKPERYFNDYAHVVSAGAAEELNQQLEQFEKDTSNQFWVVIYPKMESDSSIDDYTQRVAESWGVGQKKVNNGVVLYVFTGDRKSFIQVGRGLEGALPDATCKEIVDAMDVLFKRGDFDGGVRGAVAAIIAATKGEYKGNGETDAEKFQSVEGWVVCLGAGVGGFVLLGLMLLVVHNFGGTFYQRHARGLSVLENMYMFAFQMGLSMVFSGGGSSSGSSGGGGYSSSGGGSFGGGGAGGSW